MTMWDRKGKAFRPDVVLFISNYAEAADMRRRGRTTFGHLGQPEYNAFFAAELDTFAGTARASGARFAIATAPLQESKSGSDTRRLNDRLEVLNKEVVALAVRRPDVVIVPLAEHIDRPDGVDRGMRPDGVHFSLPAARAVVDSWLATLLLRLQP
jgi:hypothetical protein